MARFGRIVAIIAFGLLPATAGAQSQPRPTLEVAGGYADLLNLQVSADFPSAIFVSVEGNYRHGLEAVGEFSATVVRRQPGFLGDPRAGLAAYLAGPKVTLRHVPHLAAFGQFLVGAVESGDQGNGGYPAVGIQPGAGLDIHVRKHMALRVAADRRHLVGLGSASGTTSSIAMFRTGLVLF
jgi:hypothetical protein